MEWLGWSLFAVGIVLLLVMEFLRGSQPRAPMAPPVTTTGSDQRVTVQWTGTEGKTATADPTPQPPLHRSPPSPPQQHATLARESGGVLQIKLVCERGHSLGAIPVPKHRKPVLRHKTRDGKQSVFVASHAEPSGDWVYRRVGVERES